MSKEPVKIENPRETLTWDIPNKWEYNLKLAIREQAKKTPEYHREIEGGLTVTTQDGKNIAVDTVGRWIFGVPGFKGRANFMGGISNKIVLTTPLDSKGVVKRMFNEAIKNLEEENDR